MNYNNDLPGGKQVTKGDKKNNCYILYGLFHLSKIRKLNEMDVADSLLGM